jgi:hypothetical protein
MNLCRRAFIAALICWLATGVALKAARQISAHGFVAEHATTRLTEFLADFGWERSIDATGGVDQLYTTLAFEKAGCGDMLSALLIGPGGDSEHLIKTTYGGDVAFIQNGYLADDLDGVSHHIRYLVAPLLSLLGLSAAGAWPIVAISPHPPIIAGKCSAPPLEAWSKLYAARSVANNKQL